MAADHSVPDGRGRTLPGDDGGALGRARNVALTLAGGGNRAFFQIGLLHRWWDRLEPRVRVVSGCSAGACMAIMVLSGRQRESHAYWLSRRAGVTKNFDWTRLLRGHRPTPHLPIYRDTLFFALADGGFERIQALPFPLYILTAILPAFLPAPVAVAAGIVAYSVEKKLRRGLVHPTWSPRMGFRPLIVDARGCASPTQLTELVLASSATPPFTPVGRIGEHRLLDGGMIDNAPAFIGEGVAGVSRHLIVLTRPYPAASIGRQGARWYFAPSRPLPINRWDYTSAERVESTIALGADHAELAESDLVRFLAD